MKVKVRRVTGLVPRDYANEFLAKAKYRRKDGYFYCEDCCNTNNPGFCKFVVNFAH